MRGKEFLERVRKLAKARGILCSWHPDKGKGSHGVLKFGDRRTVLRDLKDELKDELKTGTLHAMLKQLDLKPDDIL